MEFGERADAVGTQELVFVEHRREDPSEPFRIEEGNDPPLTHTKMFGAGGVNGFDQVRHSAVSELGYAAAVRGRSSRCHGSITVVAHKGNSPTIERVLMRWTDPSGKSRQLGEKAVFVVPHVVRPDPVHRRSNTEEVLREIRCDVLIGGIVGDKLESELRPCSG